MRGQLSKAPLFLMRRVGPVSPLYRPAARLYCSLRSGGSVGERIVFVGDSMFSGTRGMPEEALIPSIVSRSLGGRRYVNLGVGGETSTQIRDRFRHHGLQGLPMVIWVGRNNSRAAETILADIDAIIEMGQSDRYLVLSVIRGLYASELPGADGHRYLAEFAERMAAKYAGHFAKVGEGLTFADRVDDVHLSAAGNRVIAAELVAAIKSAGWN